jgi:hypothetical protein
MQRIRMIKAPIHCDWRFVVQSCWDYWVATSCLTITMSSFLLLVGLLLPHHEPLFRSIWNDADLAFMFRSSATLLQGLDPHLILLLLFAPVYFPAAILFNTILTPQESSLTVAEVNTRLRLAQRGWIVEGYDIYRSDGTRERAANYRDLEWLADQGGGRTS